jgi:hypothetical protein
MVSRRRVKPENIAYDGYTWDPAKRLAKRKGVRAPAMPAREGQACSIEGCDEPAAVLVGTSKLTAYCSGHDPTRD